MRLVPALLAAAGLLAFAGCRGGEADESEPAQAPVKTAPAGPPAEGSPAGEATAPAPENVPAAGATPAPGAPSNDETAPKVVHKSEIPLLIDREINRTFPYHPERRKIKETLHAKVQAYAYQPHVDVVLDFRIVEREMYPGRTMPYASLRYIHLFTPGALRQSEERTHEWHWDRIMGEWR